MAILISLVTSLLFIVTVSLAYRSYMIARKNRVGAVAMVAEVLDVASTLATPEEENLRLSLDAILVQAGYSPAYKTRFFGVRATAALLTPGVLLFIIAPPYMSLVLFVGILGVIVGYMAPWFVLRSWQRQRQNAIRASLPTALDLLITCLEAGLAIEGALARVAREIRSSAPAMCVEVENVLRDIRGGVPREEAFRAMPNRSGVEELGIIGDALGRASRGGQGLTVALRELAQELRTMAVLSADAAAASAGPTMTIAMIIFILPVFFVVIMGPAAMQMYTQVLAQ